MVSAGKRSRTEAAQSLAEWNASGVLFP
jgi:hypothetical protein